MVGALDLGRANAASGSYVEVPAFAAGSPGRGQITANPEQARRRAFEPTMLARCCLSRRLPGLQSSASAADAVACWLPTLGGCVAWPC